MDASTLNQYLKELSTLTPNDLSLVVEGLTNIITKKNQDIYSTSGDIYSSSYASSPYTSEMDGSNIPPSIFLKPEYTSPATEYLFISFLEEIFKAKNQPDYYQTNPDDALTNDSSIIICSKYDPTHYKSGQYPKIVVDSPNIQLSSRYISNMSANSSLGFGNYNEISQAKSVPMSIGINLLILSNNRNESNLLGNMAMCGLVVNYPVLRELGHFSFIGSPTFTGAQKVREFGDVFMSSVVFECEKMFNWKTIKTIAEYKDVVVRLKAKIKNDKKDPDIVQIVQSLGSNLDPTVAQFIRSQQES